MKCAWGFTVADTWFFPARIARSSEPAVSHTISLDDCDSEVVEGGERFTFPSRCGNNFAFDARHLEQGDGKLVLSCEDCTERVRVLYEVA